MSTDRSTEDLWRDLQRTRRDRDAEDAAAKDAVNRGRAGPRPPESPSRQARNRRVYLASTMALDRFEDLRHALSKGLNVNATGPQRLSLLAAACAQGSVHAVNALLAAGANPNRLGATAPGLRAYAPIEHLVRANPINLAKLRALLEAGADPNTMSPASLHRPLATLLRRVLTGPMDSNTRKALYLLLDHGADPLAMDRDGQPAYASAGTRLQATMLHRHRAWEVQALARVANDVVPARLERTRSRL